MKIMNRMLMAAMLWLGMSTAMAQPAAHEGCMMHGAMPAVDFSSVRMCFSQQMQGFVAIDSAECEVHVVKMVGDHLDTTAVYRTDEYRKRHDLQNILRPVSVGVMGNYVVVLASAAADSSYVVILDGEMKPVARRDFPCSMYAMHFEHGQMFVVGSNKYGYDIKVLSLRGGFEAFEKGPMLDYEYRIAKQAEKIKHSDPHGVGLSAVAVSVVFLALIVIVLVLMGNGKLNRSLQKKETDGQPQQGGKKREGGGEAADDMAAIAAALYLYHEELHDEENTVLTIKETERSWTPWNAKYFNMNHYFNKNR